MTRESIKRDDDKSARSRELPSIIAAGLRITGNVVSDDVVHIEGEVDGEIYCSELTIGAGGRVNGHVTAAFVHVLGEVSGTICAKTVRIGRGATVRAEVVHETLVVEHGARVDGYYRPVKKVEISGAVDVRRHIGRALTGRLSFPHGDRLPLRDRPRRPISTPQAPDSRTTPFH